MRTRRYERADGPLFRQPPHHNKRLVTVPENAGPHVRLLFSILRQQGRILDDLAEASGVKRPCMKTWRNRSYPGLDSLEACLASLGWTLTPCPRVEVLPDDIAADLARITAKMRVDMPEVFSALVEIAAGQAFIHERAKARIEAREAQRAAEGMKRTRHRRKVTAANDNTTAAETAA